MACLSAPIWIKETINTKSLQQKIKPIALTKYWNRTSNVIVILNEQEFDDDLGVWVLKQHVKKAKI